MQNIREYIELSREIRQSHLDLEESCLERGGVSTNHKGVLAQFLNTEIPDNPKGKGSVQILLCHACFNDKCSNPKHLYWGTYYENNVIDKKLAGTYKGIWERIVEKYGYDEACKLNRSFSKSEGGRAHKGVKKSEEHKKKISESLRKRKQLTSV